MVSFPAIGFLKKTLKLFKSVGKTEHQHSLGVQFQLIDSRFYCVYLPERFENGSRILYFCLDAISFVLITLSSLVATDFA